MYAKASLVKELPDPLVELPRLTDNIAIVGDPIGLIWNPQADALQRSRCGDGDNSHADSQAT